MANISSIYKFVQIHYYSIEATYCPNGCNNNGDCVNDVCKCNFGWLSSDCSQCDQVNYCNGHGYCQVSKNFTRQCECVPGWNPPQCRTCSSSYLCNNNGICDPDNIGVCNCNYGYYGTSCQYCNATTLCNGNGVCSVNSSCTCNEFWSLPNCLVYEIPSERYNELIFIINMVVYSTFLLLFLVAVLSLLFKGNENRFIKTISKLITFTSIQSLLIYFQSFALLISPDDTYYLFYRYFKYYYIFNIDFEYFLNVPSTIWLESASFLPKIILFVVSLFLWKLIKNTKIRGKILQFSLWLYFMFVVSLLLRFKQTCVDCGLLYNIITTLLSLVILASLLYFNYRIWRVIYRNRQYFETDSDYDTNIFIEAQPPAWFTFLSSVCSVICYPISNLLGNVFTRLCSDSIDINLINQKHVKSPPISPLTNTYKASKYSPESSVEEFLLFITKKLEKEDLDISRIVAMLKGNWYTTVADLRNLSESDAEHLGIPLLLFRAMQDELPKAEETVSYVKINSLVKSEQKDRFLDSFGCLAENYKTSHILFMVDILLLRNFVWTLLFISLSHTPYQLPVILVFQVWYTIFVSWNRPFKFKRYWIESVIPEFVLIFVISFIIHLSYYEYHYILMLVIPILHLVALLGCFLPHIIIGSYINSTVAEETENQPLLKQRFAEIDKLTTSTADVNK